MSGFKRIQKDILIINILIPLLVGGVSALITRNSMEIYSTINVPFFAPPGYIFPIVWTFLFILMGISSYIIYTSDSPDKKNALVIYAVQLALNFTWSIIFFNFRAFLLAFLWILILWVAILMMIMAFCKINRAAALLQVPYLLWVTFATALNLAIYLLNR